MSNSTRKGSLRFTSLTSLVVDLILPYRHWLLIIFIAMLLETAMSIAAPWPLKIIIDNVISSKELPHDLAWLSNLPSENTMELAGVFGLALVIITDIGGLAGYIAIKCQEH